MHKKASSDTAVEVYVLVKVLLTLHVVWLACGSEGF